jgi:hypothetical protein
MLTSIALPVAQFVAPAIRQGAQDAIRFGTAGMALYAGIAAIALLGYGSYMGATRTYRGARSAYSWAGTKVRRTPIALPAMVPSADPAEVPA